MKIYTEPTTEERSRLLKRPLMESGNLDELVSEVLTAVRTKQDSALFELTSRFDGVKLETLKVSTPEIQQASAQLSTQLKSAIQTAYKNIRLFHEQQQEKVEKIETMPGVTCWRKNVGIEKVGLYIPGGTAPLFSSVLMLGIPAMIAGCKEIVLCTPPGKNGKIHPAILYTAELIGIRQIFKVGGAQAIAAMAYGTESIPAVYKIFGPGNQYVTAAKQLVSRQGVAIDMPAGPSEVLVYADESAQPAFVAADLLSQAEHGVDSQVVLLTQTTTFAKKVEEALQEQLQVLPRKEIATAALENSPTIVVKNPQDAVQVINEYAPEHLILAVDDAEQLATQIINAGSVFLGHYTPESVGDYASGTNHTLPTDGYARMYSGVSLDSFVKKITFQKLSKEGLQNIGPTVEAMAEAEALIAHKNAVSIRLNSIS